MSGVNFLERLLGGVAVEWKPLGYIAEVNTGQKPPEILDSETEFDYINAGTTRSGYTTSSNCKGDVVTTPSRGQGGIGFVGYQKEPFWLGPLCYQMRSLDKTVLINKYLFYFLQSESELLLGLKKEGGVPAVNKSDLAKLKIPLPCPDKPDRSLAIQAEIVRILDTFTELTAELTAELGDRQKQYNYYLDRLLTFEEGEVEWKTLGEVSDIYDSLHQTPQYSENGLSMIRVTDIKGEYINLDATLKVSDDVFATFTKKYLPKKNDLVMSRVGSYGNVGIIPIDDSACMGQNTVVIHPRINSKYLFHTLASSTGQNFIERNVDGGNQKTLSLKSIKAIPIPIVSDREQERIATILDKFDTLTTSISEGLPREIALRQQQYEYYRDLLLTFPKAEEQR
jgi:type I restriction enzyme, S subunit